jgi:hypothetical protein
LNPQIPQVNHKRKKTHMFGFIGSAFHALMQKFQHVEQDAVHAFLPFLEKGIGDFFVKGLPIAENLVIGLIKNKGQISSADRDAAAAQVKDAILSSVDDTATSAGLGTKGVEVTDGLAKLLLDTAYQKLKFTGAIIPTDTRNVGIAVTTVDPKTAVVAPASATIPAAGVKV